MRCYFLLISNEWLLDKWLLLTTVMTPRQIMIETLTDYKLLIDRGSTLARSQCRLACVDADAQWLDELPFSLYLRAALAVLACRWPDANYWKEDTSLTKWGHTQNSTRTIERFIQSLSAIKHKGYSYSPKTTDAPKLKILLHSKIIQNLFQPWIQKVI